MFFRRKKPSDFAGLSAVGARQALPRGGVLFLSILKEKDTKKKGTRGRCPRDPFFIVQICGAQSAKR